MAIPNLTPDAPSVVAQAPQNKVGADAFQRAPQFVPEQSLAAGLEQVGAGLEDLAVPLAKQQGAADAAAAVAATGKPAGVSSGPEQKSVALDANGLPQVLTPSTSFIFGRAGEAYSAAKDAGIEATASSKISRDLTDIRVQHQGDPQAFISAADGYANQWKSMYPGAVGNALAAHAADLASRHYESLSQQQASLGLEADKSALLTQIGNTESKMQVLARNGGITTPEYTAAQQQLTQDYAKLGGNKLFNYGPVRASSELDDALSTGRAEYTIGQVEATYNKSGKAAAAKMLDEGIARNEDLHLSVAERSKLVAYGLAHLDYLTNAQKIQIDASRETTAPLLELMRTNPAKVTPQMVNQGMALATSAHDAESILKFQWAQSQAADRAAMMGMTDQQRVLAATAPPSGSAPGASGRGLINAPYTRPVDQPTASGLSPQTLYSHYLAKGATKNEALLLTGAAGSEGVYNPQALHDKNAQGQYIGYGMFGHNGDRLDAMRQSAGTFTPSWQQQADFSLKELRGRPEGAAANAATSADQLADAQMAYEQPRAYTAANPRAGENYTGRLNTIRSLAANLKDAPSIAPGDGGTGPTMTLSRAPTAEQMAVNPYALSMFLRDQKADTEQEVKSARNVGEALTAQFAKGVTPPANITAAYNQLADRYPDQLGEQSQKIRNFYEGATVGEAINSAPTPAARQSYQSQVEAWERSGDLNSMAKAEEAKLYIERGAKALKEDPWNEMVNRRLLPAPPTAPDLSTPQGLAALPQSLAEHAQAAVALSSFTGVPASLFSPAELPRMKAAYQNGSADTKVALASALLNTHARPDVMAETLRQLGADPATSPLAVAGDVARYDPATAHAIVVGQAQLAAEPKLAPKADIREKFAEELPFNDLQDGVTRQAYLEGARSLYANKSAMAGDVSGILDEKRMRESFEGVTGGIREWRGSKVFAPWPNASQDHLDGAIRSVKDSDLANAVGSDGVSLPASALRPSLSGAFSSNSRFRLESTGGGDGKYLIFSGNDQHDQRQYLIDKTTKQRFVLDLGAKKDEAIARAAGPLSHTPFSDSAFSQYLRTGANDAIVGGPM